MFRRLQLTVVLLQHWAAMLSGRSYWHRPQQLGRAFVAGRLHGYFNDMTGKVPWVGPVDPGSGMPLLSTDQGVQVVFPITAFQLGLGHWDSWLIGERRNVDHLEAVLRICEWAVSAQDDSGGWPTWNQLSVAAVELPWSAMSQGEGISLLLRAAEETGKDHFIDCAEHAETMLLTTIDEGGVCWWNDAELIFEERPYISPTTILNGWIYSLFGLYDLQLVRPSATREMNLRSTLDALAGWLPLYDAGYWSRYDNAGNIASPFYHDVHVAQLQALEMVFGAQYPVFGEFAKRWQLLGSSRIHRNRALVAKAVQKLRRPPKSFMR